MPIFCQECRRFFDDTESVCHVVEADDNTYYHVDCLPTDAQVKDMIQPKEILKHNIKVTDKQRRVWDKFYKGNRNKTSKGRVSKAERNAEIIRDKAAGMRTVDIAKKFGIAYSRVSVICKRGSYGDI